MTQTATVQDVVDKIEAIDKRLPTAEQQAAREKQIGDIADRLGEGTNVPEIKEALLQMEGQVRDLPGMIDQKLSKMRAEVYDPRARRYRGAFASEEQARSFGLYFLARVLGREKSAEVLKSEHPELAEKALSTADDAAIVPEEFIPTLIELFESYGKAEANAMRVPMTRDTQKWPRLTGDMDAYLVDEGDAPTDSDISTDNVTLNAKRWGALTYVSNQLTEDAAVEVGEIIARSIARAMSKKMDNIVFNGDGTSTYFGMVGLRTLLKNEFGVSGGAGLVLGDGNAYSELTLANFEEMVGSLPQYADTSNAKWFCHRHFFWTVLAHLMLESGGATVRQAEDGPRLLFLGYEVAISQVMPKSEANSQVPVLLGDLRQGVLIGDRKQIEIKQSEHYKFPNEQLTVLGTRRVAVNCHDVGDDSATEAGPVVGLITAAS